MFDRPNSNLSYFDRLSYSLVKAINEPMPVFLIGDFNIDMLSDGNNDFQQLMVQKNLLNMVNEPTNFSTFPGS